MWFFKKSCRFNNFLNIVRNDTVSSELTPIICFYNKTNQLFLYIRKTLTIQTMLKFDDYIYIKGIYF